MIYFFEMTVWQIIIKEKRNGVSREHLDAKVKVTSCTQARGKVCV